MITDEDGMMEYYFVHRSHRTVYINFPLLFCVYSCNQSAAVLECTMLPFRRSAAGAAGAVVAYGPSIAVAVRRRSELMYVGGWNDDTT